jgi:flagellar motor switch/type III secretory pathway protein FliN
VPSVPRQVRPYPFDSLETISRSAQRSVERVRRRLGAKVEVSKVERALSEILNAEVRIALRGIKAPPGKLERATDVQLEFGDTAVQVRTAFEPELVTAMLSHLLGRTPSLGAVGAPIDATLSGALSALVLEAARRAGGQSAPRLLAHAPSQPASAVVEVTIVFQGRPYEAELFLYAADGKSELDSPRALTPLPFEVSIPIVVGLSRVTTAELGLLEPGAAWMFGGGIWIDEQGVGRGVLAAPASDTGVSIELHREGKIVLRGERETLALDEEKAMQESDNAGSAALAEAVLDTPIVVRVELGTVSLLARDFAELRPGDVIETGVRIAEPVVLRVAGREVARGELVSIEGELGVRIRQVMDATS